VDLEVPDHVADHEANEDDPRDPHDRLLADGGSENGRRAMEPLGWTRRCKTLHRGDAHAPDSTRAGETARRCPQFGIKGRRPRAREARTCGACGRKRPLRVRRPFMSTAQRDVLCRIALGAACLLATSLRAEGQHYKLSSYVSAQPGQGQLLAVRLVSPWGLAGSESGPGFVANNGSGTATSYNINGVLRPPVVNVPGAQGGKAAPTGVVYNGTSDFEIAPGKPARYVFVSEDGTISGWNPDVGLQAMVQATDPTAVYKGIAIANF